MQTPAAPNRANPRLAELARWLTSLPAVTVLLLLCGPFVGAQTRASVDLGASLVRYDGFLLSSAATITPTFEWYGQRAGLNARGTLLRFESGNKSLQGSVVGALFARPGQDWRIETSLTAGASSYADFASFWHLLGEARVRHESRNGAVWLAATGGRTSFAPTEDPRPVFAAALSALRRRGSLVFFLTAGRAFVGDTQYSDIGVTARGQYRKIVLEMLLAGRVWSQGAGHGVYGEASGVMPFSDRWAVVISGGRYPSDPVRGSIAGRYVSASLRFHVQRPTRSAPQVPVRHGGANGGDDPPPLTQLTLSRESRDAVKLVIQTPPANQVEIAGDFTDWKPVAMAAVAGGSRWEVVLPISAGIHQINLRIDGGPWTVPGGTTRLDGDYGDQVGTFVVP